MCLLLILHSHYHTWRKRIVSLKTWRVCRLPARAIRRPYSLISPSLVRSGRASLADVLPKESLESPYDLMTAEDCFICRRSRRRRAVDRRMAGSHLKSCSPKLQKKIIWVAACHAPVLQFTSTLQRYKQSQRKSALQIVRWVKGHGSVSLWEVVDLVLDGPDNQS